LSRREVAKMCRCGCRWKRSGCDGKMVPTYADCWEKSWLKKDGRLAGRDTFNLCMK